MGELDKIAGEIKACRKCSLWKTRKNTVPGEGDARAKIMFIGEAPGRYEDLRGRPFVGRAGKILDELLESAGLERGEVFITSILKCRPPNNRGPKAEEIRACTPYLDRQIAAIKPKILCTLGNYASKYILTKFGIKPQSMGEMHGRVFKVSEIGHCMKVVPMYHPAAAAYNPNMKNVMVKDFKQLLEKPIR